MPKDNQNKSLLSGILEDLGSHLKKFLLFVTIPAGTGALVGFFVGGNTLIAVLAIVGAILGFAAWYLWASILY